MARSKKSTRRTASKPVKRRSPRTAQASLPVPEISIPVAPPVVSASRLMAYLVGWALLALFLLRLQFFHPVFVKSFSEISTSQWHGLILLFLASAVALSWGLRGIPSTGVSGVGVQIQAILTDVEETARRAAAQVDNRYVKLELLLAEADAKIKRLEALNGWPAEMAAENDEQGAHRRRNECV